MENNNNVKKNNKVLFIVIALVAIAVIGFAVWGISAYLTAQDSATNTFTVGAVRIQLLEEKWDNITEANGGNLNLTANAELDKDPKVKNIGSNAAYVYLKVVVPKAIIRKNSSTKQDVFTYTANTVDWGLLSEQEAADGNSVERVYYYKTNNGILNPTAETNTLFDKIKLANITDGAGLEGMELNVDVTAYAIQSSNLDIPSNLETTEEKANYAWKKYWAQDSEVNTPAVAQSTIGNASTGYEDISDIIQDPERGYSWLYGKQVRYQDQLFRVFYVDEDGYFGDGEGTIYLKADKIAAKELGTGVNGEYEAYAYNSSKTVIRTVNPEWAIDRGTSENSWQSNEKAAAYLCDPGVEIWANYIDQTDTNVNWVIGAPSAEMYMKSYSQSHGNKNYAAKYFNQGANTDAIANGYLYTEDGSSYVVTSSQSSIANDNAMYRNSSQYLWWLASPAAERDTYVCSVYGVYGAVGNATMGSNCDVSPIASLKPGVQLELVSE